MGLVAGYAAGKTDWLCHKLLRLASQNYGLPGGILCPDIKMFKRDVWPTFEAIKQRNKLRIHYERMDGYINIPETRSRIWIFHDQDKGESIRGPNLAYFGINEATLISQEGFEAAVGRVRLQEAKVAQIAWSGTPEGFNYIYRQFIEKPRTDSLVVFGKTRDNPHLHPSFIKRLQETYDPILLEAYLEGKFVNFTGNQAAYSFDRAKHVKPITRDLAAPLWVSMDFNVNPMSAVIWQRVPIQTTGVHLQAIDEICLQSSDTYEMARVIKDKWGTALTIFPDPAGNARSTKSRGHTDISILQSEGFKDIRFKRRIQSVRDCLNALNSMLAKNQIAIDHKCKNFIADLEQCTLKSGGLDIDKSDPARTHWLDGAKNMVEYEFPCVRPLSSVGVSNYA